MFYGQILKNLWGCFSVVAREGKAARLFTPPLRPFTANPRRLPGLAAGAAAVRRSYENFWRCNKTQ